MVNSLNLETAVVALTSFTDEKSKFSFVGLKFVDGIYVSQIDSQSSTLEEFSAFISLCSVIGFSSSKLLLEYSNTQNLNSPLFWDISELAELITPELKVFPKKEAANMGITVRSSAAKTLRDMQNLENEAYIIWETFLTLMQKLDELPALAVKKLADFSSIARSSVAELLVQKSNKRETDKQVISETPSLKERLQRSKTIGTPTSASGIDSGEIDNLLGPKGPFAKRFPNYETRSEQVEMAKAIANTLGTPESGKNQHIIVEGGTGIGKSVAYLLPTVLFALRNNVRVLISTSTINLQEQLVKKDIPDVLETLKSSDVDISSFKFTQMKGKANYVCLKKWVNQANNDYLSPEQASVMSKTLLWLDHTRTGDRAELKIIPSEISAWDRISATGFASCTGAREGNCFYRHAREEALSSHIVVVNHALLLSDLMVEGSLLPDYQFLILDEAHNLESEATRQFGFRVTRSRVEDLIDRVTQSIQSLISLTLELSTQESRIKSLNLQCSTIASQITSSRQLWSDLCVMLLKIAKSNFSNNEQVDELSITSAIRSSPDWSALEIAWADFEQSFDELSMKVSRLIELMDIPSMGNEFTFEDKRNEFFEWNDEQAETRKNIAGFISTPADDIVYWVGDSTYGPSINGAPLDVSRQLKEHLFAKKQSVILTSATLTIDQDFTYLRSRLGLITDDSLNLSTQESVIDELFLGSPFDYKNSALLCLPSDAPDPWDSEYLSTLTDTLVGLSVMAKGHTMALFTSYRALRVVASDLRKRLVSTGITVLEQLVDGTADQLSNKFVEDPHSILLGTSSFWEGVDLGNQSLKILVMTRLPFNVPSDPIFSARSSRYDKPFVQFSVPQAILRFRQGFGRMIRSKEDRGAIIVLDGRISTKSYGKLFVNSLPGPAISNAPTEEMVKQVGDWLKGSIDAI